MKTANKLHIYIIFTFIMLSGCATLDYYTHSVIGQFEIIRKAKPIDDLINDKQLNPKIRDKFVKIKKIRQFAVSRLKLPKNNSYSKYADISRPYVVWNIFAAPALSLNPHTWCYPIIGCQAYRGYFSRQKAQQQRLDLENKGLDVAIGGVRAYSTLGWFSDPILNTFINYSEIDLAGLIFHELAHQVLYIKDDTTFNESFASTVENFGVNLWLNELNDSHKIANYEKQQAFYDLVINLIITYKDKLTRVYTDEKLNDKKKAIEKEKLITILKQQYFIKRKLHPLNTSWDNWFSQELNNAHLVSISAYHDYLDEFNRLLASLDFDLELFYEKVKELGKLKAKERLSAMEKL